ncbi:MAG: DUF1501 domain-containing protein, partial [Planctomycetales bacterium]
MRNQPSRRHAHSHAFDDFHSLESDGLAVCGRRNMLKAGLAGLGGLSVAELLRNRAEAAKTGRPMSGEKSVILLWMAGGPSQIDTWDPKPNRPLMNRGPFSVISTKLPGVQICEHLPRQAAMLDKFTLIRSVDCRKSGHQPNMVMQTGFREAAPRRNPKGSMYPAMGSFVAKLRGANHPAVPPYAAFARSKSHLAFGGYLGKRHDPFLADQAADLPGYALV